MPEKKIVTVCNRAALVELVAGRSRRHVAAALGVDRRTLERWIAGRARVPLAAVELARARLAGELPPQARASWPGWRFGPGARLYPPTGAGFSRAELEHLAILLAELAEYRRAASQASPGARPGPQDDRSAVQAPGRAPVGPRIASEL